MVSIQAPIMDNRIVKRVKSFILIPLAFQNARNFKPLFFKPLYRSKRLVTETR